MRFYSPGDEIYMFGFSRGAYVARFLAEMLDYIGLLCHGNEEMIRFAWKAFSQWQSRPPMTDSDGDENEKVEEETQRMYEFLKGFRETFSRPVGRIRFLGLFDTVNSVPRFETSWMQRSQFPYTARSSAMVIRHAVSIDERRAKFRQDLMYQRRPKGGHHHHHHRHVGEFLDQIRRSMEGPAASSSAQPQNGTSNGQAPNAGSAADPGKLLSPNDAAIAPSAPDRGRSHNRNQGGRSKSRGRFAPYRAHLRRRSPCRSEQGDGASASCDMRSEADDDMGKEQDGQDIDEVWFAGGHGDVGGGWMVDSDKSASHVPLTWIVREAMKAGLHFDLEKVELMGCLPSRSQNKPDIRIQSESQVEGGELSVPNEKPTTNGNVDECRDNRHEKAHTYRIHDSLAFGEGLNKLSVAAWNFMEYLPFRRMDLRDDGSWKPIRWPLPRGEVRDVPSGVRVHGSVIRRLKADESYRPGNLIVGGGGRGVKRAPEKYGIGDWVCVAEPGDVVGEIWMRRKDAEEHDVRVAGE